MHNKKYACPRVGQALNLPTFFSHTENMWLYGLVPAAKQVFARYFLKPLGCGCGQYPFYVMLRVTKTGYTSHGKFAGGSKTVANASAIYIIQPILPSRGSILRKILLWHSLIPYTHVVHCLFLRRHKSKHHTDMLVSQVVPLVDGLMDMFVSITVLDTVHFYAVLTPC